MMLEENLSNAIEVLSKTYENIDKFIKFCDAKAVKNGYEAMTERFLRYKSDKEIDGWLLYFFIKCYLPINNSKLENGLENEAIYCMNIDLKEACIWLCKYVYDDVKVVSENISPATYWVFDEPICSWCTNFKIEDFNEDYMISRPVNRETTNKRYWGLKYVIYNRIDLEMVTVENAETEIFGAFDALKRLKA